MATIRKFRIVQQKGYIIMTLTQALALRHLCDMDGVLAAVIAGVDNKAWDTLAQEALDKIRLEVHKMVNTWEITKYT